MTKFISVLAVTAAVVVTGCGDKKETITQPPIPQTEVKGIVTLNDDVTDRATDLEIANAIGNVAADCKGQVLVARGNYLVTIYCSPYTSN